MGMAEKIVERAQSHVEPGEVVQGAFAAQMTIRNGVGSGGYRAVVATDRRFLVFQSGTFSQTVIKHLIFSLEDATRTAISGQPAGMGLLSSSTPEEKLAAKAAKDAAAAEKAEQRAIEEFWASTTGQARLAYERGDEVFQPAMPLRQQHAVIAVMVGAGSRSRDTDWSAELGTVIREGWEIVSASMVFVQTGSESRDKFLASGQQIAMSGEVVGYYLFRRSEANWVPQAED